MSSVPNQEIAVYWFRNNLRLRDNLSLQNALTENKTIVPVYIFPSVPAGKGEVGYDKMGPYRQKFLVESVRALQRDIEAAGSRLHILCGDPVEALLKLGKELNIRRLYACAATAWNERIQERQLSGHFDLRLSWDQMLIPVEEHPVPVADLPMVFGNFRRKTEKKISVRQPVSRPLSLPSFGRGLPGQYILPIVKAGIDERSAHPFEGGEAAAWQRIRHYFHDSRKLAVYKQTRNGLIGTDYSSKLSAYLALGCISPVSIYDEVRSFEGMHGANTSTYWLIFELLWREFFKLTSLKYGRQLFVPSGILGKGRKWKKDRKIFDQWRFGETGEPFIDANMKELRATGFMSNRGRQNAASYLAHDLGIDWRWGASWFESQLVDYDCDSNWCNWMYVAGVGNDPRHRKFNPRLQAERYDGNSAYQKRWNSLF
jgi:deoxyribodipyrimidine photo-lyase